MKWILLITSMLFINAKDVRDQYIETYKDLAIVEMHRKGIPASIKLAQAILESRSGTSDFAQSSKNHFGIKCKTYWKGQKYLHKDDDYDQDGNLMKSCFRAYDRVLDSYVDHSNFLYHSSNYTGLFLLPRDDYQSWAKGLQKYGYATDPNYASKLIRIIESEGLAQYDRM